MPTTLADIARALGVSKMTVSRAINNHTEISPETRARILEAAQRMNYRPNQHARALTTNRSYLLGVVVPDLMHSYFAEICRDRKSTRLNSSHRCISYAVFCLKKKSIASLRQHARPLLQYDHIRDWRLAPLSPNSNPLQILESLSLTLLRIFCCLRSCPRMIFP